IDPGDDEVRKALEDLRDGDVDAVGWRAVDGEHAVADRIETQRMTQRQRVADRARLLHGCDDGDVAERFERFRQRDDALGSVAVVIGHEDTHARIVSQTFERYSSRKTAAGCTRIARP